MKEQDLNDIARLEKAIKEKYGDEAIQNPKSSWNKEKEKKYLKDLKSFYEKSKKTKEVENHGGFLLTNSTKQLKENRTCPECGSYSFDSRDDIYMIKFKCCFQCYIKYVQGREERWNSGWRPNS